MPKLFMPVPETNESCTRPVIYGIIKDLCDMTSIPADTDIFYPGDLEKAKQLGSGIDGLNGPSMMPFSNRVEIEVEENYDTERYISTAVYAAENLFIFRDDRIETYIKPVYSCADMTINFKYRALDKVQAMRWRDNIRTRISMMWDMRLHTLAYHYLIPPEFLVVLKELHRMRETEEPYNESYDTYFQANATKNASVFTTLAGTQGAWGIAEKQLRIVGYFDFEGVPELGSKEDEGDTWTISFSYKFKYDKPIACTMFYPLMVHNQLVDQNFRPNPLTDKVDPTDGVGYNFSLSSADFSKFERANTAAKIWPGVSIPYFDEFFPSSVPLNTTRVITALVNIDPLTPLFLLSLKDLGTITLDPTIINFLIGEVPYILKERQSVFTLNLYRSIDLLESTTLTIDSNLNVSSALPLSHRHYYHIRLGISTDLSVLSKGAIDRLRNNGAAAIIILNTIDPTLISRNVLPNLMGTGLTSNGGALTNLNSNGSSIGGPGGVNLGTGGVAGMGTGGFGINGAGGIGGAMPTGSAFNPASNNYISRADMQLAIDAINSSTISKGDGQIYGFQTVQTLFIQSALLNN